MTKNMRMERYNEREKISYGKGVKVYLEVYIDLIFLINFLMDLLLLLVIKKILKYQSKRIQLVFGAVLGALWSSVLVFLPKLNDLLYFLFTYMVFCYFMIYIAFRGIALKARIKAMILLYITTFFLGGVINSLNYYGKSSIFLTGLTHYDFQSNQNITYFFLVVFVGTIALLFLIRFLFEFKRGSMCIYDVELFFNHNTLKMRGLFDTGNRLYDPYFNRPVVIVSLSEIESLFSEDQYFMLKSMVNTVGACDNNYRFSKDDLRCNKDVTLQVLMIPYHSIGKDKGILPAILLPRLVIWNGEEEMVWEKVYLGFRHEKISAKKDYQIILHCDMM